MREQLIGRIHLKGIHNEFLSRDIIDYKLLLKCNNNSKNISSGIIKTNNSIYSNLKYSNEILEMGGQNLIFHLNPLNKYFELLLFNKDKKLSDIKFNLYEDISKYSLYFNYEKQLQKLSFEYDLLEVKPLLFNFDELKIMFPTKRKLYLLLWCESNLGKSYLLDGPVISNKSLSFKNSVVLGSEKDNFILKGEIFDSKHNSLFQFKSDLQTKKSIVYKNYKKENFSINLSYSVST